MSMSHVNQHQAPLNSPDHNEMIAAFFFSYRDFPFRDFGFRDFANLVVEVLDLSTFRNPKCRFSRNAWPCPPTQLYRVSRLREFRNKESRLLVFTTVEMPNPETFSKRLASIRTFFFSPFEVSGFAILRVLM
jgi:hypothetical protein